MRLSGLLVFFFLLCLISPAQKTVINGNAPGAEGKLIRISAPGDLITFWDKPLASSRIDPDGQFSLAFEPGKTLNATVSIDFHQTEVYVEPSKTYSILIGPINYDESMEVNPFIQSQNLTLKISGNDSLGLNNRISDFDSVCSAFLLKNFNALYRDRRKVLLDTFRVQLNQQFGAVKNSYFLDYATYKLAGLEQLSQYYNQVQLAMKYFSDKPILYNNLAYMEFFNSFFSKYLTVGSNTIRKVEIATLLKGPDPYKTLMKAMMVDSILKKEQLRELVMLKGLMELYSNTNFNQKEVLAVINATKEKTKYPDNRIVAEDMVNFLTRLKQGTSAPGFTLKDREQKDVSLQSLKGKAVVLCFWTTYCEECLSEMDMIRPLYDKYNEKVNFVSISADKYFSKMVLFINLKKDYIWTFLHIGDQWDVLKNYDVRSYPLFVLIDKDGNITKYPAGLPGNGLEADLQKLLEE
jgi:peroxiredoxin